MTFYGVNNPRDVRNTMTCSPFVPQSEHFSMASGPSTPNLTSSAQTLHTDSRGGLRFFLTDFCCTTDDGASSGKYAGGMCGANGSPCGPPEYCGRCGRNGFLSGPGSTVNCIHCVSPPPQLNVRDSFNRVSRQARVRVCVSALTTATSVLLGHLPAVLLSEAVP